MLAGFALERGASCRARWNDGSTVLRNLITDVAGREGRPCRGHAPRLRRHRDRVRRAGRRVDRRARRRAGHARDRRCSIRRRPSRASTPSRCPAARPSASMRPPACRRGCRSTAAASPCARAGADRAGARSCSTCSTAATRTGAAIRPIASSATRPRPRPAADFALGSVGAGTRRHHRRPQGRPRLGLGGDAGRPRGRRACGGQRRRQRGDRRRAVVLGGAVRARTANSAGAAALPVAARGARAAHQGRGATKAPRSSWSRPTPS